MYAANARTSHSAPKSLSCSLSGGLTNQENAVGNCIRIAQALGRTLVPPRPKVFTNTSTTYGITDEGSLPFGGLWDLEHLRTCALKQFGVRVLTDSSSSNEHHRPGMVATLLWSRGDPEVKWTFTTTMLERAKAGKSHSLSSHGGRAVSVTKPTAGAGLPEHREALAVQALRDHIPSSTHSVVVHDAFYALSSLLAPAATCCIPSEPIRARAAAIVISLPAKYGCLHARLEEDWFNQVCETEAHRRGAQMCAAARPCILPARPGRRSESISPALDTRHPCTPSLLHHPIDPYLTIAHPYVSPCISSV